MLIPALYKFAKIFTNYMENPVLPPYLKKNIPTPPSPPPPRPNPRLNDSGHAVQPPPFSKFCCGCK